MGGFFVRRVHGLRAQTGSSPFLMVDPSRRSSQVIVSGTCAQVGSARSGGR